MYLTRPFFQPFDLGSTTYVVQNVVQQKTQLLGNGHLSAFEKYKINIQFVRGGFTSIVFLGFY